MTPKALRVRHGSAARGRISRLPFAASDDGCLRSRLADVRLVGRRGARLGPQLVAARFAERRAVAVDLRQGRDRHAPPASLAGIPAQAGLTPRRGVSLSRSVGRPADATAAAIAAPRSPKRGAGGAYAGRLSVERAPRTPSTPRERSRPFGSVRRTTSPGRAPSSALPTGEPSET